MAIWQTEEHSAAKFLGISALIALNKVYPLKKTLIITYDEEETIETKELKVEVVPIWKWLTLQEYAKSVERNLHQQIE